MFRRLGRIFFDTHGTAELSLARWHVLRRQVPVMYALLVSNTVILAITHYGVAPDLLSVFIPAALTLLCLGRIHLWWRIDPEEVNVLRARRDIRNMVLIGPPIALVFAFWSLSLYPYGDPTQQAHVAFYMGIVTITCMLCLLSVRKAAVAIGACVMVPFTVYFFMSGHPTFIAMAGSMIIVVVALTYVLFGNYADFAALVASRREISDKQKQTQLLLEENHKLAWLDSLTGIPNRRSFQRELAKELELAHSEGRSIAVARINLDRFKAVNEIFGQITGDRVLYEVAQRLSISRPFASFLARLDSDNFALVLTHIQGPRDLDRIGRSLCQIIAEPIDLQLGRVHVTASIGFAASSAEDTPEVLYDHADYAGWLAKRDRRGDSMVFSSVDARDLRHIRRMEQLLLTADLDKEIYVVLQPQFDMIAGRTTGFEVLARWRSPVLGEVSPGDFIPMAERIGQVGRITQVVLRQAIALGVNLPRGVRLSVNLSAHDIGSPAAIAAIKAQFDGLDHAPAIDFEITETAIMRDLDQAREALSDLLALGSRIALDDFGTGHSSLTHVQRLPLHRIKIDRSFVADVTSDQTSRAIVKTMVDLCRNLGMSCVFEGIETDAQLEALVGLGGTVMQGYLFGRPMAPDLALASLANSTPEALPAAARRFGVAS